MNFDTPPKIVKKESEPSIPKEIELQSGGVVEGPVFGFQFHTDDPRFLDGMAGKLSSGPEFIKNEFGQNITGEMANFTVEHEGNPLGNEKKIIIKEKSPRGLVYEISYNIRQGKGVVTDIKKDEWDFSTGEEQLAA